MRRVMFALAGVLSAAPLVAQEVAPEAGRFAISASDTGFIRLDTETGSMAHCDSRNGVWHCDPLGDDPGAANRRLAMLAEQVARLSREIGRLADDLDTLQERIAVSETPQPVAIDADADGYPPRPAAGGLAEEAIQRLFDMVRAIKLADTDRG